MAWCHPDLSEPYLETFSQASISWMILDPVKLSINHPKSHERLYSERWGWDVSNPSSCGFNLLCWVVYDTGQKHTEGPQSFPFN